MNVTPGNWLPETTEADDTGTTLLTSIRNNSYFRNGLGTLLLGTTLYAGTWFTGVHDEPSVQKGDGKEQKDLRVEQGQSDAARYSDIQDEVDAFRQQRARLEGAKALEAPAPVQTGIWGMVEQFSDRAGYDLSDAELLSITHDVTEDTDRMTSLEDWEQRYTYRAHEAWNDCSIDGNPHCISEAEYPNLGQRVKEAVVEHGERQVDTEYVDVLKKALDADVSIDGVHAYLESLPDEEKSEGYTLLQHAKQAEETVDDVESDDDPDPDGSSASPDRGAYASLQRAYELVQERADSETVQEVRDAFVGPMEAYLEDFEADGDAKEKNDARGMLYNASAETVAEAAAEADGDISDVVEEAEELSEKQREDPEQQYEG